MYYLVPSTDNRADIYGYEPDEPHNAIDEIPERPYDRNGYTLDLYADIETGRAWWGYAKVLANEEPDTDDVESRIWATLAAAIEEGVNSLDG